MTPEYKFYHGAVLAEIVDVSRREISIRELREDGRLTSYILNGEVGVHIKHSTARLPPWQFTLTRQNFEELLRLLRSHRQIFICCVCGVDGILVVNLQEIANAPIDGCSNQTWIRVSRRRRELYSVSIGQYELPKKYGRGVSKIVKALG